MSEIFEDGISRRSVIKGSIAGASALAVGGVVGGATEAEAATRAKTVSLGSNQSDPAAVKNDNAWLAAAKAAGFNIKLNRVDHNTFQNQINQYLQGTPDNVFNWFAGYRMQFFAAKGLVTSINDVWSKIGSQFTAGYKNASKGLDGKYYFVPTGWYPWAVLYRKSVFADAGVDGLISSQHVRSSRQRASHQSHLVTRVAGKQWEHSTSSTSAPTDSSSTWTSQQVA